MTFDHQAFRARYRAAISPSYSGWLHLWVVVLTGLAVIAVSLAHVRDVKTVEWLLWPLTLLLVNFGEYVTHRWLGHRKTRIGRLFYSRHTGDHHSFFVDTAMPFEAVRDWRVVLFPAWLIYVFLLLLILPGTLLLQAFWSDNAGWIFAAAAVTGYLFYFNIILPIFDVLLRTLYWRARDAQHSSTSESLK